MMHQVIYWTLLPGFKIPVITAGRRQTSSQRENLSSGLASKMVSWKHTPYRVRIFLGIIK